MLELFVLVFLFIIKINMVFTGILGLLIFFSIFLSVRPVTQLGQVTWSNYISWFGVICSGAVGRAFVLLLAPATMFAFVKSTLDAMTSYSSNTLLCVVLFYGSGYLHGHDKYIHAIHPCYSYGHV